MNISEWTAVVTSVNLILALWAAIEMTRRIERVHLSYAEKVETFSLLWPVIFFIFITIIIQWSYLVLEVRK